MTIYINPYNFIPVSSKEPERKRSEEEKLYTGVIDYSLLTKSHVMIPNTSNDDIFGEASMVEKPEDPKNRHKSFEFFSYEDLSDVKGTDAGKKPEEPVIPGSEVRGMFRSNYEILTNSCLPFVNDDVLMKRTSETYSSGLLQRKGNGTYVLYEAEDALLRTYGANDLRVDVNGNWNSKTASKSIFDRQCYIQSSLKEGQEVFVKEKVRTAVKGEKPLVLDISTTMRSGYVSGYIIKGEDSPAADVKHKSQQKHCAHVFLPKKGAKFWSIDADTFERLKKVLDKYEENNSAAYHEYREQLKKFIEGAGSYFPVYYSVVKQNGRDAVYMSPACITREAYVRKLSTILKESGHFSCSCGENPDELCPACRLFGIMGGGKKQKIRSVSRVRFGDLHLCGKEVQPKELFEGKRCLPELSGPKLQNTEFYLKRPSDDAVFWTYDYYVNRNGEVKSCKSEINGRKFYWHQLGAKCDSKLGVPEKNERNETVRPLAAGVRFRGKLYFEGITKEELDKLVYLLNGGENKTSLEEKKHGYLLGLGKPVGYGSVAVNVDDVILRRVVVSEEEPSENRTVSIVYDKDSYVYKDPFIPDETELLKDFGKMTDFYAARGEIVSYPHLDSPDQDGKYPVFSWFVSNHVVRWKDKNDGDRIKYSAGKMCNKRKDMAFAEYLAPMKTKLSQTPFYESDSTDVRKETFDDASSEEEKRGKTAVALKPGVKYKAVVQRVEGKNVKFIITEPETVYGKFTCDDVQYCTVGKKELKNEFPEKRMVEVSYEKLGEDGKPMWKCTAKL